MRLLLLALALPLVAHAARPELDEARIALQKGAIDDVLAVLEGVAFEGADRTAAAGLLAEASSASLVKGDAALALLFAQKALKLEPKHGAALALAATSCRLEQEYTAAERYADKWLQAAPKDPAPKVLRAEIALDQGEWKRALDLVAGLNLDKAEPGLVGRRDLIVKTANDELKVRAEGLSVLKALEDRKPKGATGGTGEEGDDRPEVPYVPVVSKGVTIYTASWCGYCTKLRNWLNSKRIPFTEHDIEQDSAAADRLAAKARHDGVDLGGVPVSDVNGTLVVGYAPDRIAQLLKKK